MIATAPGQGERAAVRRHVTTLVGAAAGGGHLPRMRRRVGLQGGMGRRGARRWPAGAGGSAAAFVVSGAAVPHRTTFR